MLQLLLSTTDSIFSSFQAFLQARRCKLTYRHFLSDFLFNNPAVTLLFFFKMKSNLSCPHHGLALIKFSGISNNFHKPTLGLGVFLIDVD